ncbi:GNVR domain-containing protein [Yoonia sp.]|uniref:GNVR domain-containing protein n=1 Tax=Yoonia sp. TaxID=2212373 RepID=UPI00391949F5
MNKMLVRFGDSDPGMTPSTNRPVYGREIHVSTIMTAMRNHKLVLGLAVLAALGVGFVYLQTTPALYRASAEVMIGEEIPGVGDAQNRGGLAQNDILLESAQRVLTSQQIALAVVDDLDLHNNASFMQPPQPLLREAVQGLRGLIGAVLPGSAPPGVEDVSFEELDRLERMSAADALTGDIEVRREGRSSVFTIRYASADPALAAAVVNAYGRAIVSDQMIGNVAASARVLDWLQERLSIIQDNAMTAALEAEEFRAASGLLAIAGESITAQTIAQLNNDLGAATVQLARLRAQNSVYAELRALDPAAFVQAGAPAVGIPDAGFTAGQQRLQGLVRRAEQIESQYGPDHAEVVQLRAQIETEGRSLQRELQTLHETSLYAARALETEAGMLRESIAEAATENLRLAQAQVELRALERQAEVFDALNETYLLRLKDLEQTQTFPVTNVRVLSVADIPENPFAPRKSLVLAFMMILGMMAGTAIALIRDGAEKFIRTKEDLRNTTGKPFLGYLPLLSPAEMVGTAIPMNRERRLDIATDKRETFRFPFPAMRFPLSHFTETLRNIRVHSDTAANNKPGYVLGVVSVRASEGKSTVAANLAALIASGGRSVLLIDADLRTSGLSKMMHKVMGIGLREVLLGREKWQAAVRQEASTGLHLLPSTFPSSDPIAGDLAGSPEFRDVIREASKSYSFTVVDLSPLGPVSDARALLPVIDGLVMVVEWNKMTRELLEEVLSRDPILYDKLLGVAFNKTSMESITRYGSIEEQERYGYGNDEIKVSA